MNTIKLKDKDKIVVLSPHIDDAFLSMGGAINSFIKQGIKVTILNVFTKSNFSVTNLPKEEVEFIRIQEEEKNKLKTIKHTKCTESQIEIIYLGLQDAGLRGFIDSNIYDYPKGNFRSFKDYRISVEDLSKLKVNIENYFDEKRMFFIPSCCGNHIDHNLVRKVFDTINSSKQLPFLEYTEIPYSLNNKRSYSYYQEIDITIKLDLVYSYSSQLYQIDDLVKKIKNFSKTQVNKKQTYVEYFS